MDEKIYVKLLSSWGDDRDIANSAWVSTGKNDDNRPQEDVERVISQTLIPHNHGTPLESVWLKYYLHIPIFIERQFDKTRISVQDQDLEICYFRGDFSRLGITQNELSLRYRSMENSFYSLPEDIIGILSDAMGQDQARHWQEQYKENLQGQMDLYQDLLNSMKEKKLEYKKIKRVREVFRGILGTSYFTDMQIILNLRALEVLLRERLTADAQPEARQVAKGMLQELVNASVASVAIRTIIEKNGWQQYLQ